MFQTKRLSKLKGKLPKTFFPSPKGGGFGEFLKANQETPRKTPFRAGVIFRGVSAFSL
jgi:hypothetical protein